MKLSTKQSLSIMLRDFARATCPAEAQEHFYKCENEAIDFRRCVQKMYDEKSHECRDLADWISFMDKSGGYAGLMRNFSVMDKAKDGDKIYCTDDGTEDGIPTTYAQQYKNSYYLGQTARDFLATFEQLPAPTRYMLNKSLNYQVQPLIGAIRAVAREHMMDYFKQRDEGWHGPR